MKTVECKQGVDKMVYALFIGLSFLLAFGVFVLDKGYKCFSNEIGACIGVVMFGLLFSAFPILVYRTFTKGRVGCFMKWFFSILIGYSPLLSLIYFMIR